MEATVDCGLCDCQYGRGVIARLRHGVWLLTAAKASSISGVWCISEISSLVQSLLGVVAMAAACRIEPVARALELDDGGSGSCPKELGALGTWWTVLYIRFWEFRHTVPPSLIAARCDAIFHEGLRGVLSIKGRCGLHWNCSRIICWGSRGTSWQVQH